MNSDLILMRTIAKNAVEFVEKFFRDIDPINKSSLPPILKNPGKWMAIWDSIALGIFFLNQNALKRVIEYQDKGWNPFPGFLRGTDQETVDFPVAIRVGGTCNFFSSNRTSNIFAFVVEPGASFTIVYHFHEIKDASGKEFKYNVDLAFILGIFQGEQWTSVELRLSELLKHTISVWHNAL
jgi:hypothetical protein